MESVAEKPPQAGQTGPKIKSDVLKADVLATVSQLDIEGYSQREMAQEVWVRHRVNLTQQQMGRYVKQIVVQYRETRLEKLDDDINRKLAQYQHVMKEAWAAWYRSKKNSKRLVQEFTPIVLDDEDGDDSATKRKKRKTVVQKQVDAELAKIKEIITREGRLPASQYLSLIISCLNAERELLGLDEAKKVDITTTQISWDSLLNEVKDSRAAHQSIEDEIAAIGSGPTVIQQPEVKE